MMATFKRVKKIMCLKTQEALYGLKQAPRAWYKKLDMSLSLVSFVRNFQEHAMYMKNSQEAAPLTFGVYVDDLMVIGSGPSLRQ